MFHLAHFWKSHLKMAISQKPSIFQIRCKLQKVLEFYFLSNETKKKFLIFFLVLLMSQKLFKISEKMYNNINNILYTGFLFCDYFVFQWAGLNSFFFGFCQCLRNYSKFQKRCIII